jgi:hypothetical protein
MMGKNSESFWNAIKWMMTEQATFGYSQKTGDDECKKIQSGVRVVDCHSRRVK